MRIKVRVTREDGSVVNEEIEATSYQEAKDMLMAEDDVVDVSPMRIAASPSLSKDSTKSTFDNIIGTEQDASEIIGC